MGTSSSLTSKFMVQGGGEDRGGVLSAEFLG
jgi:hypothetical protein